ncbi:hypothetical protein EMPS_08502 [Entomortierella parvispora]|uniref:Uncharacterized protein n=1 Tax=Entomortierella parvispora TaxID=205924 RepID=A0A9P3HGT0_9FUNG|nr:hypothetical protein EMPS_08502 [Entomortierella parvispora]
MPVQNNTASSSSSCPQKQQVVHQTVPQSGQPLRSTLHPSPMTIPHSVFIPASFNAHPPLALSSFPPLTHSPFQSYSVPSSSASSSSPRPIAMARPLLPSPMPIGTGQEVNEDDAVAMLDPDKQRKASAAYWKRAQTIALVNWLSDPVNCERYRSRPSGQTLIQVQAEIADHLNGLLKTKLNSKSISSSIQYMRSKYQEAKRFIDGTGGSGSTDPQLLKEQILEHCPHFEELDKLFKPTLVQNSGTAHAQPSSIPLTPQDDPPSDTEPEEDTGVVDLTPASGRKRSRDSDSKRLLDLPPPSSKLQEQEQARDRAFMEMFMEERRMREEAFNERERMLLERDRIVTAREKAVLEREADIVTELKRCRQELSSWYEGRQAAADARLKRCLEDLQEEREEFRKTKDNWVKRHCS